MESNKPTTGSSQIELHVVVKVASYFSLPDGEPKRYCQRRTLPSFAVNRHSCVLLNLIDFIGEKCTWGSKQYITLWRSLDDDDAIYEIKTDEELLAWFDFNLENGVMRIDAEIKDFDGPLQFSPTKRRCHPKERKRLIESSSTPPLDIDPLAAPSQATNSVKERATNESIRKAKTAAIAKKTKRKGANDDEAAHSDTESLRALSDSSYDSDLATSSDSDFDSDPEFDPDTEIVDEEDEDDVPVFAYDVDDPCIKEGVIFQDTKECKSVVLHHAIWNDHAFDIVKIDTTRFTAKCKKADKGCKWRFHASTSKKKYVGCKVKTSGPKHTCGSFNKCGDTMASNKWVADRAICLLKDDPEMGPKELQDELKKKYKFEVPYYRVFRGKEST